MIKTTGFRNRKVFGTRNYSYGDYGTGFYFTRSRGWIITSNPFFSFFHRSVKF